MIVALALVTFLGGQPQTTPTAATEKKICRTYPKLGSRVQGDRICRTKAEWMAADQEARETSSSTLERTRLRTLPNQ